MPWKNTTQSPQIGLAVYIAAFPLDWNYDELYVDLAMPNYVEKQLVRYEHVRPKRPQHCPYAPNPIKYGAKTQDPVPEDESPLLDMKGKKYIQQSSAASYITPEQ